MTAQEILGEYYDEVSYSIDENYYTCKERGETVADMVGEEVDSIGLSIGAEDMYTLVDHFTDKFENYNPHLF